MSDRETLPEEAEEMHSGWSSNAGQSATQGSGVAAAPTDYRALEEERKAKQAQRANWAAR